MRSSGIRFTLLRSDGVVDQGPYREADWENRMDSFYDRLIVRAATIDELLSDDFESLPGQKSDADFAAHRLAAWCRSCANGDWSLFGRRLERDGLTIGQVLTRFATVRRNACASRPAWVDDARWIDAALQGPDKPDKGVDPLGQAEPCAFEPLFTPVVEQAEALLWSDIDARAFDRLNESARVCLRLSLARALSGLCTPAIYERFVQARNAEQPDDATMRKRFVSTSLYDHFVTEMKAGGFRRLFEDKPVLLRLIAAVTRQWIDTSCEFIVRLDTDLAAIRRDILHSAADSPVSEIRGDLSDPHNGGRSVKIVSFEDGTRVVYKPKALRLDVAWHALVERLNGSEPPLELKTVRAIARDGYGWTEFIDHAGCADQEGCARFFRRAGAWLALFHCFAAADMHQENIIAAGDHPVPIDLEMILQASADERKSQVPEGQAFDAAREIVSDSVMTVGLLPAYGRSADNHVFVMGGMNADWNLQTKLTWCDINSDAMRPSQSTEVGKTLPNLPYVDGCYAQFGDHVDEFVAGFEDYARFLRRRCGGTRLGGLLDGFADVPARKIIRATTFYGLLLLRLRNHRNMDDGVLWSAHADFIARLADWDTEHDPIWPLQRAERLALVALNVPHFVSLGDGTKIVDATGNSAPVKSTSGLDRARARIRGFDERAIIWQIEVIRQNTYVISKSVRPPAAQLKEPDRPDLAVFTAEADRIAAELSRNAIRRGPSAAWIGLDWLGDSEFLQLVSLGPELYNGVSGIAVFLAAHAAVTGSNRSGDLALAALSYLRTNLKSRNAARMVRSLGIGGATGLGSIVYALTVTSKCLRDEDLLADAIGAAGLLTDDLIAQDEQLDVMAGSAGAILGLLRLYRDTQSGDVLSRATKCAEHLIARSPLGLAGRQTTGVPDLSRPVLNGMSHGAAGIAYALASLAEATGREKFARVASEWIAYENSSYDAEHNNWPDLHIPGERAWLYQWCHGAPGIGLARLATVKRGGADPKPLETDIGNALNGAERGWPGRVDTLCCGTLGSVEFFCEAAKVLGRGDLGELALRRLAAVVDRAASTGDYRWNAGKRQFNLGLFRGLAGVGYVSLRQVDGSLPNVLIWD
jgi:type 2 lantibiotic biosynthesis protein LanM